jgi:uncharacterized iron-regulated protein
VRRTGFGVILFLISFGTIVTAADKSLRLQIGDPSRRNREAKVVLDAITDTSSGAPLTPGELAEKLAGNGMIFVGESHTSMDFHRVQLRILEELRRRGKKLLIGLEMYPYTEQQYLDQWHDGLLTEEGFVRLSKWYSNWGYHWDYYRDIFLFARDNGIPMYGVNTPREVVSAVRKKGFQNLTPEEAAHIPPAIDTTNADHFTLFKAFFDQAEGMHARMTDEQWKGMFDAQCTWDATMAYNSIRGLEQHPGSDTLMVVLIGSGHVAYGLGIQRQAAAWYKGRIASVIPIQVVNDKDEPIESVQASYADFVWGLPPEKDPLYPELGISTVDVPGQNKRRVISVSKDSVAKTAGFQEGDILVSMDGNPLQDRELVNRHMAEKRWGDSAVFVVLRDGRETRVPVQFRRRPPAAPARQAQP